MPSILWFRRDLRLRDHPALSAAAAQGEVLPVFILDPRQLAGPEVVAQTYLMRSLHSLNAQLDDRLCIRTGEAESVIADLALEIDASAVHISADYGTFGRHRDAAAEQALHSLGVRLIRSGSPYAIAPGSIRKGDGQPYRVYTPFLRTWLRHGWRAPANDVMPEWITARTDAIPNLELPSGMAFPEAGEPAARARWQQFRETGLLDYADARDRPDLDGTSQLGAALRFGELHPRTLLADLGDATGHEAFRRELAWREFYADVLWHNPDTAYAYLDSRFAAMEYDEGPVADARFDAWREGRTGYPFVDAGMRQLLAEGWMHNRVRMVVASFFIKDLHLEWQRGAAWFARMLRDYDQASNQHGWQWTAGCGTDAAPYFRIFNPVAQGRKFDPHGEYVRRYVPELRHLAGGLVHEPWSTSTGSAHGYPQRIVDHASERAESLRRYAEMTK